MAKEIKTKPEECDERSNITPPQSRAFLEYLLKDPVSNAVGFKSRWSSLSSDEEFSLEENEIVYPDDVVKVTYSDDVAVKVKVKQMPLRNGAEICCTCRHALDEEFSRCCACQHGMCDSWCVIYTSQDPDTRELKH